MKIFLIFIIFCFVPLKTFSETMKELVKREGLYYKKFSDIPFTGKISGKSKRWETVEIREGYFKNGKKHGTWITYYNNDQLRSVDNYVDGIKHGTSIFYKKDGSLSSKCNLNFGSFDGNCIINYGGIYQHRTYQNRRIIGTEFSYYKNGQLYKKGNYKNNKKDGVWITFWRNGQIKRKGNYVNHLKEGLWIEYLEDGRIRSKGNMKNDKRNGQWIYNKDNGEKNPRMSGFYENDIQIHK